MRFDIAPDSILGYTRGAQPPHKAWRFALANLVWGVWIVAVPVLNSMPWRAWLPATTLSYALFMWLYLRAYAVPIRLIKGYVAAIAVLGFVLSPINPGALTYVIYACVFTGFAFRSMRISFLVMLGLLAAYTAEALTLGWSWPTILSVTLWALVIGGMNMMYRSKGQADAQLRLSHEEIRRLAATAERERIGRDLHDLLGHTLSLVALKSELAARLVERDAAAAGREMREVERVAREALTQVRAAVSGLHAPQLLAELASARLLLETAGILVDSRTDTADLPPAVDAALAMVLREAATNIQRHAGARRVGVVLTRARERVRLCIEDDGRGGVEREGNGLIGMRERLAALGGILQIDSAPGRGTRLCAELGCPPAGSGLVGGALAPGSLCAAAALPAQQAAVARGADSAAVGSAQQGGGR